MGFALIALLVELNSIFLHIRELLLMHQFEKSHSIYKLNNFMNFGKNVCYTLIYLVIQLMDTYILLNKYNDL